jgi:hypothetical protein
MKLVRILPLALALAAPAASAQYAYNYVPSTGDSTLDAVLQTINALYNDEPDYYVDQIVYETRAQPVIVREYIVERRYAPADVYMIGELAQLSGRPFGYVAERFDANRGRGWGVIAKDLGIKPGSAQFHALKDGTTVFVERGRGRGKGAPDRVVYVDDDDGHPGKGHGKDKAKGQGKGKGKNK